MRCRITQFARESVGLCPSRGSYVREFELSHSNPVNRIIKITHELKLFTIKFPKTIFKNHLGFTIHVSAIKLRFKQR